MKKKSNKFSNLPRSLKGPIIVPKLPASLDHLLLQMKDPKLFAKADEARRADFVAGETAKRLHSLASYLRLDPASPTGWFKVAEALAIEFMPGFQVRARGKGAPRIPPDYDLYDEVQKLKKTGLTAQAAFERLNFQTRSKWKGLGIQIIRSRYYTVRKKARTHLGIKISQLFDL